MLPAGCAWMWLSSLYSQKSAPVAQYTKAVNRLDEFKCSLIFSFFFLTIASTTFFMQQSFDPIIEAHSGRDLIPEMVNG
jgi:hypothetical protein